MVANRTLSDPPIPIPKDLLTLIGHDPSGRLIRKCAFLSVQANPAVTCMDPT